MEADAFGSQRSTVSKQIALTICFSSLYAVACLIPIFRIVGSQNFITLAAMLVPAVGILFGPLVGTASALTGGLIVFFTGTLAPSSLVSGVVAGFLAGLIQHGKWRLCLFTYGVLLLSFGFYPLVGPVWLFPPYMWFQIVGFSALAWLARHKGNLSITIRFLLSSLVSTLAGQIAGSLVFEILYLPVFNLDAWRGVWMATMFLYPAERTLIAFGSTVIGVAVFKALKVAGFTQTFNGIVEKRS
jgi:hypothetical protein